MLLSLADVAFATLSSVIKKAKLGSGFQPRSSMWEGEYSLSPGREASIQEGDINQKEYVG